MLNSSLQTDLNSSRVRVDGKLFRADGRKLYVKGFCYGPFALNSRDEYLPEPAQMAADLEHMRHLGANTIRLYSLPSPVTLDEVHKQGLKVILDVPWEKHRCFCEDWTAKQAARRQIRAAAELAANHPAVMAVSVVNEIPNDVVRFHGHEQIERFVEELAKTVKDI